MTSRVGKTVAAGLIPLGAGDHASQYEEGLSICVPAYNEEATIREVILEADTTLRQISLPGEILVIDDCSTDRTWEILCNLKENLPDLHIRRHTANQGIAVTFGELYRWARKSLVFLNAADGQWRMDTVIDLLPLAAQNHIVVASRLNKHYSARRQLISWLFNFLPRVLFATRTYDAGSVKLVSRFVYDIPIISSGVFGEAERLIRARRRGLKIGVKDVPHLPRRGGKASGARPALILEAVWDMLKCWFDMFVFRRT